MSEIKLTEEFSLAYRFVTETNQNIFLTGKAGTGKTTFLKYLRRNSRKNMVVAAPTGVAAINAGGVTLHSLFQLPFAPFVPAKDSSHENAVNSHSLLSQIHYHRDKLDMLRKLELLIIDETSMVAAHAVDAIDTILRSVRRRYNEPFGGVQVLFIGDLHQLPPVVKRDEWEFLRNYYASIFFFDSLVLKENIPVMIELKQIFRQQDDAFIEILNGVRNNDLTLDNYELLNSRLKRNFVANEEEGYITLTTHNSQSDAINKGKLQELDGRQITYLAHVDGNFPEHIFPAEQYLDLKVGAQVMFLKNDTEERKYFNGKIGTVTYLDDDTIRVKCKGEHYEIEVQKYEWKNMNYTLNQVTRQIEEEELGSFQQYPLRLAWAITIHKSQGLTFDKLIIDAENAFANGQVYVALSRCTTLEGLVLTSPVNQRFLGAHQNLTEWTEKNQNERGLKRRFDEERELFIQKELQNIFSWKNWGYELRELNQAMKENVESLTPEAFAWMDKLINEQKTLEGVAAKFKDYMTGIFNQNPDPESNDALQKRIKDAANYFSKEIANWRESFRVHPLSVKAKKVSRKLDEPLEAINIIVQEILRKINFCKEGFLLDAYLEHNKKAIEPIEKIKSSNATLNNIEGGSELNILYNRINEFRKKLARENGVPISRVFSNGVIEKICENLPCDNVSLINIKGINKIKIKPFTEDIVQIVNTYCKEKSIEPKQITDTVGETLKLIRSGKSITETATERNFAESTIEAHLAKAIGNGQINISEVMPMSEVDEIAKYYTPNGGNIQLAGIKERVPADVSWGKLRMVLAWLQKEK
ncbi:MAG TPA: helix-turn-helix domain-containing protein [Bacteroidia bacterium]|nr:helix-turn-helix domain-containing protein [Bacteroidia bacterium]